MNQRKSHLVEFLVNVAAGLSVAAVTALAAGIAAAPSAPFPVWIVIGMASAIGLIVVGGAAYINWTRREQRLRQSQTELALAQKKVSEMRELNRTVALLIKEEPQQLTRDLAYTVDPNGADRIESTWQLAFAEPHQGRVFITEDWSTYPTIGEVTFTCESEDSGNSSIVPVMVIDEPTRKSSALFLDPPVGNAPRLLRLKQTWPGLWKDLRENGADYVEMTARPGLKRAETRVYIPLTIGRFKWKPNANKAIKLTAADSGAQQTLTMLIEHPEPGQTYRADLEKTA